MLNVLAGVMKEGMEREGGYSSESYNNISNGIPRSAGGPKARKCEYYIIVCHSLSYFGGWLKKQNTVT